MWDHVEGRVLLRALLDLGLSLHNIGSRTKDAIKVFREAIEFDSRDPLLIRHRLLRCYLDKGDGLKARELLEEINSRVSNDIDASSCVCYNKAFIEHISLLLEEEGASKETRDTLLTIAYQKNPYTIWLIKHHALFKDVLSRTELVCDVELYPHIASGTL